MKILSFILAVYILGLSMLTCSDASAKTDTCQTVACVHIDAADSDACHETDDCSPLCMCQCCGSVTLIYNTDFNFSVPFTTSAGRAYGDFKVSGISYSIWQPPKTV